MNAISAPDQVQHFEHGLESLTLELSMARGLDEITAAVRSKARALVGADGLGVPVVPTVGRRGLGLKELFRVALQHAHAGAPPTPIHLDREVEEGQVSVRRRDKKNVGPMARAEFIDLLNALSPREGGEVELPYQLIKYD